MANSAQVLYRLQLLDSEINEQSGRLREAESSLRESPELAAAREAHRQASEQQARLVAQLKDLEFELERTIDRVAGTEHKLYGGGVGNPKELGGLQQDYESSKKARLRLEDDVLSVMAQSEQSERHGEQASASLSEVEANWRGGQEKVAQQVELLRGRIADLKADRAAVAARVKPADLALYQELLLKCGGRAVALLVGQMCQGCRMTIPMNRAQLVRRSADLITCTNCGRILAMEP